MIYHVCDSFHTGFCHRFYDALWIMDHVFSYLIIATVPTIVLQFGFDTHRDFCHGVLISGSVAIGILFGHDTDSAIISVCIFCAVTQLVACYPRKFAVLYIQKKWTYIFATLSLIAGVLLFIFSNQDPAWYWLVHSLWHITIMTSVFLFIQHRGPYPSHIGGLTTILSTQEARNLLRSHRDQIV